jgi:hypothetical protein
VSSFLKFLITSQSITLSVINVKRYDYLKNIINFFGKKSGPYCRGTGNIFDDMVRVHTGRQQHEHPEKKYFVLKLIPPRPTFAQDMTEEEKKIMKEHGAYWIGLMNQGIAIVVL